MTRCGAAATRREDGQALLLALFVLLVLGISLALLALSMRLRLEEQQREVRRARVEQVLDGVVAETLARLARDSRFAGVPPRLDGAGVGWSAVERVGPGVVRIDAGATLGARRARVGALARLDPGPPRILSWQRGPRSGHPRRAGPGAGGGLQ